MVRSITRRAVLSAAAGAASATVLAGPATAAPREGVSAPYGPYPPHLLEAERLLGYLDLLPWEAGNNKYRLPAPPGQPDVPDQMTWGDPGDPASYRNLAQCASFQTGILKHSYPQWATAEFFAQHFGSPSPQAWQYHRVFTGRHGSAPHFTPVLTVDDLRVGDLIALDDLTRQPGDTDTGHMMLVRRRAGTYDGVGNQAGSTQHAVQVVDCTKNPHGVYGVGAYSSYPDSRITSTSEWSGGGFGHLMLYADTATGVFTGIRWSVNSSVFNPVTERAIAAARLG
ncbi:hypothetical protein [Kutzneria sp. CA-103260]|uniref:hypothetical protein n=1 Tax=Kutzneria sp. CA-103260 TaxID=2802641 RepID=UPI001BA6885B|nr:hypothetical protein [Kutzneria sp. CA-103260]QUQ64199.1 hypothetical protein JJ691_19190 [Kutzneria sp. CA-103260]